MEVIIVIFIHIEVNYSVRFIIEIWIIAVERFYKYITYCYAHDLLAQELEGDLTVQLVKLVSPTSRELTVESVEVILNNTHISKQQPSTSNNTTPPPTKSQPTNAPPTPYPITTSQSSSSSSSPSHNEDVDGPPEIGTTNLHS